MRAAVNAKKKLIEARRAMINGLSRADAITVIVMYIQAGARRHLQFVASLTDKARQ